MDAEIKKLLASYKTQWPKLVAKMWTDEGFKKKLLQNPKQVLQQNGITAPNNLTIKILEDEDNVVHLVFPGPAKTVEDLKFILDLAGLPKKFQDVFTKAWQDPNFKKKLFKNPEQVLKEAGILLPSGKNYKVIENDANMLYFVIPEKPSEELTEQDLKRVSGAGTSCEGLVPSY
jgi:hypothetical protein